MYLWNLNIISVNRDLLVRPDLLVLLDLLDLGYVFVVFCCSTLIFLH